MHRNTPMTARVTDPPGNRNQVLPYLVILYHPPEQKSTTFSAAKSALGLPGGWHASWFCSACDRVTQLPRQRPYSLCSLCFQSSNRESTEGLCGLGGRSFRGTEGAEKTLFAGAERLTRAGGKRRGRRRSVRGRLQRGCGSSPSATAGSSRQPARGWWRRRPGGGRGGTPAA